MSASEAYRVALTGLATLQSEQPKILANDAANSTVRIGSQFLMSVAILWPGGQGSHDSGVVCSHVGAL